MSAPDYKLVTYDDWQALVCNGEVVLQNHSLSAQQVLEEMEIECKFVEGQTNEHGEALDEDGESLLSSPLCRRMRLRVR